MKKILATVMLITMSVIPLAAISAEAKATLLNSDEKLAHSWTATYDRFYIKTLSPLDKNILSYNGEKDVVFDADFVSVTAPVSRDERTISIQKLATGPQFNAAHARPELAIQGPWEITANLNADETMSVRIKVSGVTSASQIKVQKWSEESGKFSTLYNSAWYLLRSGDDFFVQLPNATGGIYFIKKLL